MIQLINQLRCIEVENSNLPLLFFHFLLPATAVEAAASDLLFSSSEQNKAEADDKSELSD